MIYLLSRASRFSPQREEADAQIFRAVVRELALRGLACATFDEERLPADCSGARLVLSMGRAADTLCRLAALEAEGVPVLNAPTALQQHTRSRSYALAAQVGMPLRYLRNQRHLPSLSEEVGYPLWLKNDDSATTAEGDVRFVASPTELIQGLQALAQRKVGSFVACEHVMGDWIKFYGVAGTPFFHCERVQLGEEGQCPAADKFGLAQHATPARGTDFDAQTLHQAATRMAEESGIVIYGGDAIVREDGSLALIDFNDWPSFAPCVDAAAAAIADLAAQRLRA